MNEVEVTAERRALPPGWRWVRLEDVAAVVNGVGFPVHLQGHHDYPHPFIKVSDMNSAGSATVVSYATNTVDNALLREMGGRVYPIGTVIFPKVGGAVLTNKKRLLGVPSGFDNNVMGIVSKPGMVLAEWVYHWMLTVDLAALANIQALPSVRKSDIAALSIPLPPLPEQQRIVARLTAQLSEVERAQAAVEAQQAAARALPAAYLREVFPRPGGSLPSGWRWVRLGEVCAIRNGFAFDGSQFSPDQGTPLIRIRDLKTNRPSLRFTGAYDPIYLVEPGSLLIGMYGEFRCYRWSGPRALLNQRVCNLIPVPERLDASFVAFVINEHLKRIEEVTPFTTVKHVSAKQVENLVLPLPPLSEQRRIGDQLTAQMAEAERIATALDRTQALIAAVPPRLLQDALTGGL